MKRYEEYPMCDDYGNWSSMEEEKCGYWVKYSDHISEIKKVIQKEREAIIDILFEQKDKYIYSNPYDSLNEQEAIDMCIEAIRRKYEK